MTGKIRNKFFFYASNKFFSLYKCTFVSLYKYHPYGVLLFLLKKYTIGTEEEMGK